MDRLLIEDTGHAKPECCEGEERATVEAIVAWLRSTPRARGVAVSIESSPDIARLADAIERGEWRRSTSPPPAGVGSPDRSDPHG